MADWQDILRSFYGLLGGQPQQQPTAGFGSIAGPPSPGVTSPQTTTAPPTLAGALTSPLGDALLSGYFSYLSRPRGPGHPRWEGLGLGGLSGLQAFQTAREQQLKYPLEQAKLQTEQAQLGIKKTEAEQTAEQFQQRKLMVDQFDKDPQMQKLDPLQRMVLRSGLMTGKLSLKDLGIEPITPYQKAELDIRRSGEKSLEEQRQFERGVQQQRVGLEERGLGLRQQEIGLREQELANEIQKQRQEAGLLPLKQEELRARIKELQTGGKPKAVSAVDLDRQVLAEAKEAYKARPWSEYRQTFDDFLQNYRAKRLPELQAEAAPSAAAGRPKPSAETGAGASLSGVTNYSDQPPPAGVNLTGTPHKGSDGNTYQLGSDGTWYRISG